MHKVLFVLNHAPHYRELFLRKLGQHINLTVFAKPCHTANLIEPSSREHYIYSESESVSLFVRIGIQLNYSEWKLLNQSWDKIILSWDLHHLLRYLFYFFSCQKRSIIWMGHIYGSSNSYVLKYLRRLFLNSSGGVLTYSEEYASRLRKDGIKVPIWAFNNSEVSRDDFKIQPFCFIDGKLKMIYVGRFQKRKRLERLISLAQRNPKVEIIIAGNNMNLIEKENPSISALKNITILGPVIGDELINLMAWCDVIVNPGHLGLLVINGARFGRPIIVDSESVHAPEVIVAHEASQFFVNWNNANLVDELIDLLIHQRSLISSSADRLTKLTLEKYTVEYMTDIFLEAINKTLPC